MGLMAKVVGRDHLRRSRLHDEKGHLVRPVAMLGLPVAAALGLTQRVTDRPYLPWVPFAVIRRLRRILTPRSRVLEFGSGRSTRWFAAHAAHVVSIEDDPVWFTKMQAVFAEAGLTNVDYRLRLGAAYYDLSDLTGPFDLVVVDGTERGECLRAAGGLVKPGGFVYLDNSDTFMTIPDGHVRVAEEVLQQLADAWASPIEYFVGYAPGSIVANEGALLRRPEERTCLV